MGDLADCGGQNPVKPCLISPFLGLNWSMRSKSAGWRLNLVGKGGLKGSLQPVFGLSTGI
jgi:hypothetical protein